MRSPHISLDFDENQAVLSLDINEGGSSSPSDAILKKIIEVFDSDLSPLSKVKDQIDMLATICAAVQMEAEDAMDRLSQECLRETNDLIFAMGLRNNSLREIRLSLGSMKAEVTISRPPMLPKSTWMSRLDEYKRTGRVKMAGESPVAKKMEEIRRKFQPKIRPWKAALSQQQKTLAAKAAKQIDREGTIASNLFKIFDKIALEDNNPSFRIPLDFDAWLRLAQQSNEIKSLYTAWIRDILHELSL